MFLAGGRHLVDSASGEPTGTVFLQQERGDEKCIPGVSLKSHSCACWRP